MNRATILLFLFALPLAAADHREAAKAALPTLAALAKKSPETAGITEAEVQQASVDAGVRVMVIGLRDLRAYDGRDPHQLLHDIAMTMHAVRVGGTIKSAISIAETDSGTKPVEFARTELLRRYFEAVGSPSGGEFLLHVPALNSYFVGRDVGGELLLTPLHDLQGFARGIPVRARDLLAQLAKEAQRIKDDELT